MTVALEQLWAGWRSSYVQQATAAERAAQAERAGSAGERAPGDHGQDPAAPAPDPAAGTPADDPGAAADCVFCRLAGAGAPSAENGVVWRGRTVFVVLNAFPYASGHVLVMPIRHVGDLDALSEEEAAELWQATRLAARALSVAYQPDGLNVGANLGRAAGAGIPAHLHLHALPRWSGDTNFMTSVGGVRVLPEALPDSWRRLRAAWPVP